MEEIEVVFELHDKVEEAKEKLKGLEFVEKQNIIDIYFYDPNNESSKPNENKELGESLRLRHINDKYYVSYKIDKFNDKNEYLFSDNAFREIEDPEEALHQFNDAGLKELVTVKKTRYVYKDSKYFVYLEDVTKLGRFVEIEKMCKENAHVEKVKQDMIDYSKSLKLNLGNILDCGKPELMLRKQKVEVE